MTIAEQERLLGGERTQVVRGRMPRALVARAKNRTGIASDTELTPIGCCLSGAPSQPESILSSDFQATLRRLKPDKHRQPFKRRAESDLDFLGSGKYRPAKLLYDMTVYIDILQDRFPHDGERVMRAAEAWHSPFTGAELAAACGMLDPAYPGTRQIVEKIVKIIERRSAHRMVVSDPDIWQQAGILSGALARLQGYAKDQRRRILNDALLFARARKYGYAVLTRILTDFDFLQQLDPSGRVLFYNGAPSLLSRAAKRGHR
jgi:hypothetical protein